MIISESIFQYLHGVAGFWLIENGPGGTETREQVIVWPSASDTVIVCNDLDTVSVSVTVVDVGIPVITGDELGDTDSVYDLVVDP